jgi:hypothetical protein
MKKSIITSYVLFSVISSAFLAFDSSKIPSNNNEGLRKPAAVVNDPSGFRNYFQTK